MRTNIEELQFSSIKIAGTCSRVYFLFHNNEIAYIGEGWNCFLRVAEHTRKESDKEFTTWNFIPIDSKEERKDVEKKLRVKYKPKYNRI